MTTHPTPTPRRSPVTQLQTFLHHEAAGGVLLLTAAITALLWANSPWSGSYTDLWNTSITIGTPASMHPLVGTWLVDTDTEDPENPLEVDMALADGGWIAVEAEGLVQLGRWEPTGPQTADLMVWTIGSAEDGGGMFIVRASIEVAADGQSFTAAYTFELISPDGTSTGQYGPGTASATRLSAEPMGEPLGTFEELFAQFEEASPEASPAP